MVPSTANAKTGTYDDIYVVLVSNVLFMHESQFIGPLQVPDIVGAQVQAAATLAGLTPQKMMMQWIYDGIVAHNQVHSLRCAY